MKHISIAAKISISITERQQNLNTLANFFSEYIIDNNVNFQIDVFCWVLGMPPRQSVTAEETQIIDSVTEQENEQNFEPESAPIILLSQLRINQTASSPPQTHASNLDVEEHPENRDEASTGQTQGSTVAYSGRQGRTGCDRDLQWRTGDVYRGAQGIYRGWQ